MSKSLGIIGGGQLGSMLSVAAKKLNIKTVIYSDDKDAPGQNFCDDFIFGNYDDKNKIYDFANKVDIITFEFENIPFVTLNELNKLKTVLPKPSVNRLIQHRLAEKDFINRLNIRTTRYVSIENKSDLEPLEDFLPGILKTTTMGYDGKGQYPIKNIDQIKIKKINDKIEIYIKAKSFLHSQVRIMVGTLIQVGEGKMQPEDIKSIIKKAKRENAGPTAPASGLYLLKVYY